MRIFVTGATGWVGTVVVRELLAAGHQVLGLARSDEGAEALKAAGAEVHRGSLEDPGSLRDGAAAADGVIHTAFIHDFTKFAENCETDRRAIGALADALEGSDRHLIVTSGTAILAPGKLGKESDPRHSTLPRVASEQAAEAAAARGVRVSVMRLPPSVHGKGDHGFVPRLIDLARQKGAAAYVGEGLNRWPAVHRLDAAHLYRLVIESKQPGEIYHAVGDEGVPFREIAEVIGRRLNLPVVSKAPGEAAEYFGWFAHFASMDVPASSAQTRQSTGWRTVQPGLIADIDQPCYFGGRGEK